MSNGVPRMAWFIGSAIGLVVFSRATCRWFLDVNGTQLKALYWMADGSIVSLVGKVERTSVGSTIGTTVFSS